MINDALAERPAHIPEDRVVEFDIYAPPGVKEDFHLAWHTLQEPGVPDIVWTPRNGGHWIPTRASIILDVLSDYERFSSRNIIIPKSHGKDHNLIPTTIDPPAHRPYRKTLNDTLSPKVVKSMDDNIRAIAVDLIESFRADGACNFTTAYAEILPIKIFLSMMNLPLEDTPKTKYWSDQLLRPDGSISFADALRNLNEYLEPYVDERAGKSGTDMLSRLINSKVDGRTLSRDEAMKLAVQVLIAGIDTVVNFLGFVFLFLARNPEHRQELAANPEIIPEAVEEFLRRYPIVTIGREVRNDIEFHGVQLKAGEMIATPTPLGGTDERFNENPLALDFHRTERNSAAFGTGHHICPGKTLARTEIGITLEEWMRRIPDFELAPGAEVTFTGGIVGVVDGVPLVWPAS